jgi:hypothetical protein
LSIGRVVEDAFTFEPLQGGGRPPVVDHLDRLGNLSDWLTGHTAPFEGITKYNQFRIFARETDEGQREVRVAARLPSSKAVELHDLDFHGLTAWVTSSPVFLAEPNTRRFLSGRPFPASHPVPCAQLAEPARYDQDKARQDVDERRLRRDVTATMDRRRVDRVHRDDNLAVLSMLEARDDLPFDWDIQFYRDLAKAARPDPEGEHAGVRAAEALASPTAFKPNDFVMVRLSDVDYPTEPIAVAKIAKETTLLSEGDGKYWPAYELTYLVCTDLTSWDNATRKYQTCRKATKEVVYASSVLGTLEFNKVSSGKRTLKVKSCQKLQYYVDRVLHPEAGQHKGLKEVAAAEVAGEIEYAAKKARRPPLPRSLSGGRTLAYLIND